MKPEAIKDYYIVNGKIKSVKDLDIFSKIIKPPIYEVIRVIDGVPVYLEDHLSRMRESANIVNKDLGISEKEIREDIKAVILRNNISNLNIKLLWAEASELGNVFIVYCVESFYPPEDYYTNGIKTILYTHERDNPNAKVLVTSFKEDVTKAMTMNDAFEALLVSKDGYITEGSRSNIFFVKDEIIYTAPKEEILLGITRKHLFIIANILNIKIIEKSIHKDDINDLDGAIMTGTSVNMLPIAKIDNIKLGSVDNKIIREVNNLYIKLTNEYIAINKDNWI